MGKRKRALEALKTYTPIYMTDRRIVEECAELKRIRLKIVKRQTG